MRKLYQYSKFADLVRGILPYNAILSSCVTLTSAALFYSGVPNIGLHSYILELIIKASLKTLNLL